MRFPLLNAYLEQVPHGFDSFPGCAIKASVIRDALKSRPLGDDPELPGPIRAFLQSPPPVSTLMPEVLSNAILLAMCDAHFRDSGRRAAWDWMHATTYRLLRTPLYRILFAVMSPERLLAGLSHRWQAFRRGTELTMARQEEGSAQLKLVFPTLLHNELTLYLLAAGFQAALDCAGARATRVELASRSATEAVFACNWSRG